MNTANRICNQLKLIGHRPEKANREFAEHVTVMRQDWDALNERLPNPDMGPAIVTDGS